MPKECRPWSANEGYFEDGYGYRHLNVYDRSLWSRRLNATFAVFDHAETKALAALLLSPPLGGSEASRIDRLGIGLYGVNPHTEQEAAVAKQALATVATLEGQVLQVRRAKAGATVGYGSTYCVSAPGRLVTIGAGYADGVPRLLSNQGHVFFQGRRLPIVGRVSMDSLVVELTDESALACEIHEGDWVEIFGPNLPVEEVAQQAQTIAYEVFTGLGSRLQRLS